MASSRGKSKKPEPAAPAPPTPAEELGLTTRQGMFVLEYLRDFNGARAAKAAGYSARTAKSIAHELLQKPHIREYIEVAKVELAERTKVSLERVVQELARVAFLNMKDIARWKNGKPILRDSSKIRYDDAAGIKSFTYSESESTNDQGGSSSKSYGFATHDKVKALELLAKHTGALETRPPSLLDDLKDALEVLDKAERPKAKAASAKKP